MPKGYHSNRSFPSFCGACALPCITWGKRYWFVDVWFWVSLKDQSVPRNLFVSLENRSWPGEKLIYGFQLVFFWICSSSRWTLCNKLSFITPSDSNLQQRESMLPAVFAKCASTRRWAEVSAADQSDYKDNNAHWETSTVELSVSQARKCAEMPHHVLREPGFCENLTFFL